MQSRGSFFKSENKPVNPLEPTLRQQTIEKRIQEIVQNFPSEFQLNLDSQLPVKTFEGLDITPILLKKWLSISKKPENSIQKYVNSFDNKFAPLSCEALYLLLHTILITVKWEPHLFLQHTLVKQLSGNSWLGDAFILLQQFNLLNRDNFKILYTMHREDRSELCMLLTSKALFSVINSRQMALLKKILPYSLPWLHDLMNMFSKYAANTVTRQDIHDLFALMPPQMTQLHAQMVDVLLAKQLSLLPMRIGCLTIADKLNEGLSRLMQGQYFDMSQAMELVRAGAHPHLSDNDGNTILHKVIVKLVKDFMPLVCMLTIKELVQVWHADLNRKNHIGISPWEIFVSAKKPEHISYALHLVELGADFKVMALLEGQQLKSSYIDMLSARKSHDPQAKKLLKLLTTKYKCTFNEHYKIHDSWHIDRKAITRKKFIGSGSFGHVYEGEWRGRSIAMKNMPIHQFEKYVTEIQCLQQLWSDNASHIIQFYGYHMNISTGSLYIFMELAALGSLDELYTTEQTWVLPLRVTLVKQLIEGLFWIHKNQLVHADIKSGNVLVDEKKSIKIIDFGLSIQSSFTNSNPKPVGTPLYMAPELLVSDTEANTFASDIYSLGFTICEMIGWKFIFHLMHLNNDYPEDQLAEDIIAGFRPEIPADCPASLAGLIRQTWKEKPADRPTIEQLQNEFQAGNNAMI